MLGRNYCYNSKKPFYWQDQYIEDVESFIPKDTRMYLINGKVETHEVAVAMCLQIIYWIESSDCSFHLWSWSGWMD